MKDMLWYAVVALVMMSSGCTPCSPTVCPDCECVNDTVYSQCRERENFYHNILILQGYFDKVCQPSSNDWQVILRPKNLSIANATFEFRARPHASLIDGVIGLGVGNVSAYNQLVAAARFNSNGFIDVVDGATYTNSTYQYSSCVNYRIQMHFDFPNQTYSVAVDNGTTLVQLAGTAAFRANSNALDTLVQISDVGEQETCIGR